MNFIILLLTKQIQDLTAERKKLVKSLTELREKFDTTVTENAKRENLIQDLKEEIKVNFLANQVHYMYVNHFIIPTEVIVQPFNTQEKDRFSA